MLGIRKFRKRLLICAAVATTAFSIGTAGASLQDEMDALFGGMTNVTPPGVFESQRRGVIAGGRFTTKTRIFNEDLVSFVPPSFKAGCGGVDMYGGSLSFVDSDKIVELLRAVAANAKGYFFQVALDVTCETCSKHMENFQKKIQALNQYLGNSCQLAQGIVNDGISAITGQQHNQESILAMGKGLYDDFFQTKDEDGESPKEKLKSHAPDEYKKLVGNLVWKQLQHNNAAAWFRHGDRELLEAMMSLTGTVIVTDLVDDPSAPIDPGSGSATPAKTNPVNTLAKKLKLADFIEGGEVEIYSCQRDYDLCMEAGAGSGGIKTVTLTGIQKQIEDKLLGGGSTAMGIVQRFATNTGNLRAEEQAFMANLPNGVGALIRNLAILSPDAAKLFINEASGAISLAMMYEFADQLIEATRQAIANTDSPHQKQALELINASRDAIREEYRVLLNHYGSLTDQIEHYNALIQNIRKQRYTLTTLTKPPRSGS